MYSKLNANQQARVSSTTRSNVCKILAPVVTHTPSIEVRCYKFGQSIFVSRTRDYPGPFSSWDFQPTGEDGLYKIRGRKDGSLVVATGDGSEFRVEHIPDDVTNNAVQIKSKDGDKAWTVGEGFSPEWAYRPPQQARLFNDTKITLQNAKGASAEEQTFYQIIAD
ncbi:hypothetical protein AURDEDRAFT_173053 [Auricularia subglabra TFB-10046 SS5]|uniref:Uncharacterized protein n=1 Tax=Auricularia subglabra (strain TFB-10046 / SS5) TaxID=717982 RepID=J0WWJ1_AURST|nr:hypothetical protein AURDEDRAFT_173053 [Auricularia subglabra TFB-10046 SS5]